MNAEKRKQFYSMRICYGNGRKNVRVIKNSSETGKCINQSIEWIERESFMYNDESIFDFFLTQHHLALNEN